MDCSLPGSSVNGIFQARYEPLAAQTCSVQVFNLPSDGDLGSAPRALYIKGTVCFLGGKLEAGPKIQADTEEMLQTLAAEAS